MQHEANTLEGKASLCSLAIESRIVIAAQYNGAEIELHPHQLIERNGATYLRAMNPAKSIRSDEEPSLGFFHLCGLSDIALRPRQFEPLPPAAIAPARVDDAVLATL